jgi:exonuclease III
MFHRINSTMKNKNAIISFPICLLLTLLILPFDNTVQAQENEDLLLAINFDNNNFPGLSESGAKLMYVEGIKSMGLDLVNSSSIPQLIDIGTEWFSNRKDFSVSVWIRSEVCNSDTAIILSNADFRKNDMGIYGKRRNSNGFTLYSCNGTWGWNIGNGELFYNYEPVTKDQPIADEKWHQIVFTYNAALKEVCLYYDGINRAILSIGDLSNRDFTSDRPMVIGKDENIPEYGSFPGIIDQLQVWGISLSQKQIQKKFEKYATMVKEPEIKGDVLTVLNWNIWHGGTHFSKDKDGFDGAERIVEMIKDSGADIVLMQETYGAGSKVSSSLGYYYYEASSNIGAVWGANLSVMSRFPIEESYMIEKRSNYGKNYAFNNGGVKIKLSKKKNILAFSNWYNGGKPEDLEGALKGWENLLSNADNIPIVWGGDFNSVSHLDDGLGESGHSKLMINAGFTDSYRQLYPDPKKYPCLTAPRFEDRIDFIYYKGSKLKITEAGAIIDDFKGKLKNPGYPSDHLGIISKFKISNK